MKYFAILASVLISFQTSKAQSNAPFKLIENWESNGFDNPESVALDTERNVLYVSNVNGEMNKKDGNGYISKLSTNGTVIKKNWITSLNAPKGLAISKGKLYIADIDEIVEVDIESSKISARYYAEGATFLNDIVADKKGVVYASNTFGFSGIYKLSDQKVELWLKDEELNLPNGLLIQNRHILVGSWGADPDPETFSTEVPGRLMKISLKTKRIKPITKPFANLDGIVKTIHGILVSDWLKGELLYYSPKKNNVEKVLDVPKGSADIAFNRQEKIIYVPQMLNGSIVAYSLKGLSNN